MTVVTSDDSSAGTTDITVEGYVGTMGESAVIPQEATVKLSQNGTDASATTDKNGKYSVSISVDLSQPVKIECASAVSGQTVYVLPYGMYRESEDFFLDMKIVPHNGAKYTLGGDLEHAIVVSDAKVDITVIVGGSGGTLVDAEISLTSITRGEDPEKRYAGKTNGEGNCKLYDVSIGDYEVTVTCHGYITYSGKISVKTTNNPFTVTMNEKTMETYYGLPAYHILVILGVSIGLILVAVAHHLCARSWKRLDRDDLQN